MRGLMIGVLASVVLVVSASADAAGLASRSIRRPRLQVVPASDASHHWAASRSAGMNHEEKPAACGDRKMSLGYPAREFTNLDGETTTLFAVPYRRADTGELRSEYRNYNLPWVDYPSYLDN